MGWLIALGSVVVLAILPLGASVIYDGNGPLVRIIAGPVKLQIFPMKKKAKPDKPKKEKAQKEKSAPQKAKPKKKPPTGDPDAGGSILDFWPFVELALNFLGDLRRKIRLNHLKLHMTMAGDDPCNLAINYGRANGAMATLLSQLDRLFVIHNQDVHINCDFTASQTTIIARLDITITLGRIIGLVVRYGIRALKTYLSIQKKRKGGADL